MGRDRESIPASEPTPKAAVGRLSLYLRQLESMHEAGQQTASSSELGNSLEITDAQVRKDLAYFGQFGYPGIGYKVEELRASLREVLGRDRTWNLALIGAGNLGRALINYSGFQRHGFGIEAIFDVDSAVVGQVINGRKVLHLSKLETEASRKNLQLAILAVPAVKAQEVADLAARAGIAGILNFAPTPLKLADEVSVVSVDLGQQIEQLCFKVMKKLTPPASD